MLVHCKETCRGHLAYLWTLKGTRGQYNFFVGCKTKRGATCLYADTHGSGTIENYFLRHCVGIDYQMARPNA